MYKQRVTKQLRKYIKYFLAMSHTKVFMTFGVNLEENVSARLLHDVIRMNMGFVFINEDSIRTLSYVLRHTFI